MTDIEIIRVQQNARQTLSVVTVDRQVVCFALELPWRMNERSISCIPCGTYDARKYISKKYNRVCICLAGVHGRDYVSIHPGNTINDTHGCILPGMSVKKDTFDTLKVVESSKALNEILKLSSDFINITIR